MWRHQATRAAAGPGLRPAGLRRRSYFADDPGLAWEEIGPSHRMVIGELTCSFGRDRPRSANPGCAHRPARGSDTGDLSGSLAYSADSGPDWSVEELGTGIGTVLCEATYTRVHEGSAAPPERPPGRCHGRGGRGGPAGAHPPVAYGVGRCPGR